MANNIPKNINQLYFNYSEEHKCCQAYLVLDGSKYTSTSGLFVSEETTQFYNNLYAFKEAISFCISTVDDNNLQLSSVCILSQHKVIMDWVTKGCINSKYIGMVEEALNILKVLNNLCNVQVANPITKADNLACKLRPTNKKNKQEFTFTSTSLFGSSDSASDSKGKVYLSTDDSDYDSIESYGLRLVQ